MALKLDNLCFSIPLALLRYVRDLLGCDSNAIAAKKFSIASIWFLSFASCKVAGVAWLKFILRILYSVAFFGSTIY